MSSWVEGAAGSTYDVDNLPYGVFSTDDERPRVGVRIGDRVLDVSPVAAGEMLDVHDVFARDSLNPLMAQGPTVWASVRTWLTGLLTDEHERDIVEPHLRPLDEVTMRLPFRVADYVDFYCSLQHASNLGRIFRPDSEPLLPNWRHLPVGYHGRAGTVVVSGTPIRRPSGQRRGVSTGSTTGTARVSTGSVSTGSTTGTGGAETPAPEFGPSARLDIETELGFVVGVPSAAGEPVPTTAFTDHVFGVVALNDWSARDIQAWEYVPLGPFLGKSFATSIAAWVTPLAALEAARVPLPGQEPEPLDYLRVDEPAGYDIDFEVLLNGEVVSRPPYASTYWSPAQMLAHMTVNGASLRTGDLFASGTISGDAPDQRGSFIELSWGGAQPFAGGHTFLEDGDQVVIRATAPGGLGGRIALGEVSGRVTSG